MKVKMKQYEKEAIEYANIKFNKPSSWAEWTIAKDAFLSGFRLATSHSIEPILNSEVEIELNNGEHQLK